MTFWQYTKSFSEAKKQHNERHMGGNKEESQNRGPLPKICDSTQREKKANDTTEPAAVWIQDNDFLPVATVTYCWQENRWLHRLFSPIPSFLSLSPWVFLKNFTFFLPYCKLCQLGNLFRSNVKPNKQPFLYFKWLRTVKKAFVFSVAWNWQRSCAQTYE